MFYYLKSVLYAIAQGHSRLVKALAALYGKIVGHNIDPNDEVLVTVGAMQAIFSAIIGNVDDGDEVIIIEPFFDSYASIVRLAGGTVRYVQLKMVGLRMISVYQKPNLTQSEAEILIKSFS